MHLFALIAATAIAPIEVTPTIRPGTGLFAMCVFGLAAFSMLIAVERSRAATSSLNRITWILIQGTALSFGAWAGIFSTMFGFSVPADIQASYGDALLALLCGIPVFTATAWLISNGQNRLVTLHAGAALMTLGMSITSAIAIHALHIGTQTQHTLMSALIGPIAAYFWIFAGLFVALRLRKPNHSRRYQGTIAALMIGMGFTGLIMGIISGTSFVITAPQNGLNYLGDPAFIPFIIALVGVIAVAVQIGSGIEAGYSRMAASLRKAESQAALIIASMRDAHLSVDSEMIIRSFNPAAEKLLGYTAAEVIGQNVLILIPEGQRSAVRSDMASTPPTQWKSTTQASSEVKGRCKNGEIIPAELTLSIVPTDGAPWFSVVLRDLRERQAQEQETRRLAAAVAHSADGITILNKDGIVLYANPAYERMMEVSAAQIVGNRAGRTRTAKSDPALLQDMLDNIERGRAWSGRVLKDTPGKGLLDIEVTVSPLRDESGACNSYVIVNRDMTEKRCLEQQLLQSQKLESIGQLAAGIAHEINTPAQFVGDNVRFIRESFGEIRQLLDTLTGLAEDRHDDMIPVADLADIIHKADIGYLMTEIPAAISQSLEGIGRVANIVGAMKSFSHPGQDITLVNINRALENTATVASSEWKLLADIRWQLDENLPEVPLLPGEFNQVILNMVVNAAHAIAETGKTDEKGTITIGTALTSTHAVITIADTGAGIPAAVVDRVFDPFFTTKKIGKGTGQGLAIAHNVIVGKHKGRISVESTPGQGTCFTIQLPLTQAVAVAA